VSLRLKKVSESITSNDHSFDVLDDVLRTLRFRGSVFFSPDLAAPWGMSVAESGVPRFHIALSGNCFVGADGEEPVHVQETDIVLLSNGDSHWIADEPGRELISSESAARACELNNPLFQTSETTNRILCGLVRFDQGATHPILDSLPQLLHFSMLHAIDPIRMTAALIDTELRRAAAQGGSIVDRLAEVLFLQLLDHHLSNNELTTGFLSALRDRRIHQALSLIHQQPELDWSLARLGEQTGMSRATLVRRFQDTVGLAPMAYIANWRLTKAYNLLKYSAASLEQVADTVGFASARTLSRAFNRHFGYTPNELRRGRPL